MSPGTLEPYSPLCSCRFYFHFYYSTSNVLLQLFVYMSVFPSWTVGFGMAGLSYLIILTHGKHSIKGNRMNK